MADLVAVDNGRQSNGQSLKAQQSSHGGPTHLGAVRNHEQNLTELGFHQSTISSSAEQQRRSLINNAKAILANELRGKDTREQVKQYINYYKSEFSNETADEFQAILQEGRKQLREIRDLNSKLIGKIRNQNLSHQDRERIIAEHRAHLERTYPELLKESLNMPLDRADFETLRNFAVKGEVVARKLSARYQRLEQLQRDIFRRVDTIAREASEMPEEKAQSFLQQEIKKIITSHKLSETQAKELCQQVCNRYREELKAKSSSTGFFGALTDFATGLWKISTFQFRFAYKFATDSSFRDEVLSNVKAATIAAKNKIVEIVESETFQATLAITKKALYSLANPQTWIKAAIYVAQNPSIILTGIMKGVKLNIALAKFVLTSLTHFCKELITDPLGAIGLKAAWRFAKNATLMVIAIGRGDRKQALMYAAKALINLGEAVFKLSMFIAPVTGVVRVLGGSLLRRSLTLVAKRALTKAGQAFSERIVASISQRQLERTVARVIKKAFPLVERNIARLQAQGQLNSATAFRTAHKIFEQTTSSEVKPLIQETTEKVVGELARQSQHRGLFGGANRRFLKECKKLGLTKAEAKEVWAGLRNPHTKAQVERTLAKDISANLERDLIPKMKEIFQTKAKDNITKLERKLRLNREITEAIERGANKGFADGARRAIREGVEDAIKAVFRYGRGRKPKRFGLELPSTSIRRLQGFNAPVKIAAMVAYERIKGYMVEKTRFAGRGSKIFEILDALLGRTPAEDTNYGNGAKRRRGGGSQKNKDRRQETRDGLLKTNKNIEKQPKPYLDSVDREGRRSR